MSVSRPHSDALLERLLALHPKRIDLSLDRLTRLLAALGDPHLSAPPVIHVAGTNGKGSVCAYLRAGLEATGARVHVYTSPHLERFHERIRLAGALVDERRLADALARCERANAGQPITFFEITTAAAFLLFAEEPADWLVLEVGLGGRLDATNVIDRPRAAVATPVSYDHQEFLGDSLDAIAREKAGIFKRGAPAVIGRQEPEAERALLEVAEAVGAPVTLYGREFTVAAERGRLVYEDGDGLLDLPAPRLPGAHQVENAGVAVATLRRLGLSEPEFAAALEKAEWAGRLQRLRAGPLVDAAARPMEIWLDGGHNVAAGAALAAFFAEQEERAPAPLFLICGMLANKDAEGFLRPFAGLARRVFAIAIEGEPSTRAASDLAQAAIGAGLAAEAVGAPTQAIRAINAELQGAPDSVAPRVLVCGSLYLAGRLLREHQ